MPWKACGDGFVGLGWVGEIILEGCFSVKWGIAARASPYKETYQENIIYPFRCIV